MATDETKYETQFTKENVVELKNAINKAINEYAETNVEGGKLDAFVILASLNQAEYELILRSFPKDDQEAKQAHDQMALITDKVISQIDDTRKELNTKVTSELLANAHVSSIVSEFYARRRDEYLTKVVDSAGAMQGTEEVPVEEAEDQMSES